MTMNHDPVSSLIHAAKSAVSSSAAMQAMRDFYADLDEAIRQHDPTCWNRGQCCQFGEFGHRLYVTTLETAYYLTSDTRSNVEADACPHSMGHCQVRAYRPLGCRVFFCDPASQDWQSLLTEQRLAQLRQMHDDLNIPYYYCDWMRVLDGLAG
jgi:hypothetical protein